MMRFLLALAAAMLALLPLQALAHPHIFIDARARIVFDGDGLVEGIHNDWTFDEAYSAWAVQGLDADGDGKVTRAELQALADDNMVGLAEYEYYTFAGEGPDNLSFINGSNASITYEGGRTTLSFDVALAQPYRIRKALEIAINDPEYYVAITFAGPSAVELINAPAGCGATLEAGHDLPDAIADQLYALPPDVTKLPPELEQALRGVQGAILVKCPPGAAGSGEEAPAPSTALDAATQLAEAQPIAVANDIPFGGPPPEPGLNLPRTGFFGWVAQQQKDFYIALTAALGRLKSDWTAFWVLGGLSFLYGIFHAAGPGHGKVVISSYVLANEKQVRRGVLLSFFAAMMQSAVAVAFVLILALGLGLTSLALSDAANWIGILSYAMVALLGLWLILRHVFGWGQRHHVHSHEFHHDLAHRAHAHLHGEQHHHHHDGDDDDEDNHVHVVTADQVRGGWREQLGVVVAVGLRPCSGALVVLVFALSQGLLAAGIAAVFLMGLGTAITTGTLAALAVGAKGLARRIAGADNPLTAGFVWWAELAGAVAVLGFGVILLIASF